ncbi:formimidoylglutamase [Dermabacter hominis]|uniref:formimidoylglutamase n=1 Tax=Dermabacter hominis TaxID=36740 RepID=UPI00242A7908|nr:formimidoylglutamase [Dermabacter hominis]
MVGVNTVSSIEKSPWQGRVDGEGVAHARWHQRVSLVSEDRQPEGPHVALAGFASHEGVRRNHGRVGAAEAPAALRSALAGMALHGSLASGEVALADWGDVATIGEALEEAQAAMGSLTATALGTDGNRLTLVLGGGHETAWASYLGLREHLGGEGSDGCHLPSWGVLNLDAHFDLRSAPTPTSGTPFLQMAEAEAAEGRALNYAVLGIAEPGNTRALFETADALGVEYRTDLECLEMGADGVARFVEEFAARIDVLYLTIDLDVLPAHTAPGVSAPAALGVDLPIIVAAVRAAARTGKLSLMDIVELNPRFDVDGRTAKSAARLVSEAAHILAC